MAPQNELNGSRGTVGLPVLSDNRKKSPFADWSYQPQKPSGLRLESATK